MKNDHVSAREWGQRILIALLFTAVAGAVMIVFSPWGAGPKLGRIPDYLAKIGVGLVFLAAALLARRSVHFEKYWQLLFALFILMVAISLEYIIGVFLIKHLGVSDSTPAGWALPKLNECFVVVSVIITFTLLSGNSLGSIYIQKGNLKLGLIIGLIAFFIFVIGAIPMASLFNARDLGLARVIPLIPWILMYVLANGSMEELLFRGLFLRKLQPLLGSFLSIFVIAFIFTGLHSWVSYTADQRLFLAVTFPLALALGYIMQKTDSIWGSILFHAGMDIPIMLGIFSGL
jgi:membrane protease YdiL (CAAX protease family)